MRQSESIILAFANVVNDNLKHLNPELQKIRNVLKDAEEKNFLNIIEHSGVTYNSLSFLLNSVKGKNVTMLHFSGHSSKNGLLVQSRDESGVVSKKPLADLIKAHRKFRFVFLNSCYSKDIAEELISAGVPYVIGTSNRVKDGVAAIVAAKFYSLLAKSSKTIEEAFLLTKGYIEDPMNDDDTDDKEAFRTFQIFDETKSEYPWQLYQGAELKDKDKNWILVPEKSRWMLYAVAAIGVILISIGFFVLKDRSNRSESQKPFDTTTTKQNVTALKPLTNFPRGEKYPKIYEKHSERTSTTVKNKAEPTILKPAGKKIFANLKIVDSMHQYNNDVTSKLREFFTEKGYQFGEAGADLPGAVYDNQISGQLFLSQPVKSNGPFNTVIVNYNVRLTLRFSDGTGRQVCGEKDYSTKVSTDESDTKERIIEQGLDDVLNQLQKETNFPFCVKK